MIAAGFQQQDIDFLARCKPPSGIESRGFVDRKIAPVDLHMSGRRTWRMKKQTVDMEGINLFLDPLSSSAAWNLEARTNRGYAHPEPLNHLILISRTVRRAYSTYISFFYAGLSSSPYFWIKREYESVVSVIWCFLNTRWSTLHIIESHYLSSSFIY